MVVELYPYLTYFILLIFLLFIIYKRMSSGSEKSPSRERSKSKGKAERHKMFITNLDGTAKRQELETELGELFSKYGSIKEISVKRSKNGDYSFAFVEYQLGEDAEEAIRNLNGTIVRGKPMKVQIQDDGKRRKDPDKGCYTCGRKGHFARECRSNKEGQSYRRRSRSRSESDERGKRKRHRSESPSSEKQRKRSRNKKDKDRKHSSKDKKKKKHKKKRKSSSDSDS